MYEESKEMKMIRDVRDKHYEETKEWVVSSFWISTSREQKK